MKLKIHTLTWLMMLGLAATSYAQAGLDFFVKAENLRTARQYPQAMVMYEKAIEKEPNNLKYAYNKCMCFADGQKYQEAIDCFSKYLEKDTSSTSTLEMISILYRNIKKPMEAVKYLEKAHSKSQDPGEQFAYKFSIIEILVREGKITEVGKHIADAKALIPESDDIRYIDALYKNAVGKHQGAVNDLKPVVENLGGETGEAYNKYYYELGYAYHLLGQYTEANSALGKVQPTPLFDEKVKELKADFYYEAAKAYEQIYDNENALKMLEIALGIAPNHTASSTLKDKIINAPAAGTTVAKLQKDLMKATNPQLQKPIISKLAIYNYKAAAYDEALRNANEYLAIDPRSPGITFLRGLASHKLSDNDEAEHVFSTLARNPKLSPDVRSMSNFSLGLLYKTQDQLDKAKKFLKLATKAGSYKAAAKLELRSINIQLRSKGIDAGDEEPITEEAPVEEGGVTTEEGGDGSTETTDK